MKLSSDVVALIPAFNEERNIAEVVVRTKRLIDKVVVVDDGSSDRTFDIAKENGAVVVRQTINLGKGSALKTGVDYILGNMPAAKYVVMIDADMQLYPEDAPRVLEPLLSGRADVVMGMRDFSKVPFRHRLGNLVWRTAFNLFFGTHFRDTNCGYIAMTADAARKLGDFHGGYIIEAHLLSAAVRKNLRVAQVPVDVDYSKVSPVPRGIRMVAGVLLFILKDGLRYRIGGRK